jgi:hypothetical protein
MRDEIDGRDRKGEEITEEEDKKMTARKGSSTRTGEEQEAQNLVIPNLEQM